MPPAMSASSMSRGRARHSASQSNAARRLATSGSNGYSVVGSLKGCAASSATIQRTWASRYSSVSPASTRRSLANARTVRASDGDDRCRPRPPTTCRPTLASVANGAIRERCAHRLRRRDGEPPGEHREASQQDALGFRQQAVAPISAACMVACLPRARRPPTRIRKRSDRFASSSSGTERTGPGAGELDGQRDAVEALAHLDRDVVGDVDAGTVTEQLDGGAPRIE